MNVYVTKYALSNGVTIAEGELIDSGKYFKERTAITGRGMFLRVGRDCSLTRTEAVLRVADMRTKKLAALRKQMKRIEALSAEERVPQEKQHG